MKIPYLPLTPVLVILLFAISSGCARKDFFAATPVSDPAVRQKLEANPAGIDSVVVQAGKHYDRSSFHNLFWGEHYRPVWNAPVEVAVFDMDTTKGGLKFEKLGGGFQTTSMTLTDEKGRQYALRTLDKDPSAVLPPFLRRTFALNILRDQTSAGNPYGALVVAPLAAAAGIPHTMPELVYVRPHDSDFGKYEAQFSDRLFLLENKYDSEKDITPDLGNARDIDGSGTVLHDRFDSDDVHIDQRAFAKARLFDMLIGDWDRHEGQWEWAQYKKDGETTYRPIPKDRDNAFFRFQDGLVPWLFSRNWGIRKFESFRDDFTDVKALTINAEFIDRRALSELTRQQFDSLAQVLQSSLTDTLITQAVHHFPDTVFELIGPEIIDKLKNRRDQLPKAADEFYEILAEEPLVVGTDQEERFVVERLNNDDTEVTVYRKSDDTIAYHRIFHRSETSLLSLYGLAGDDEFEINGKVDKGIKIKIVGGRGEDEIKDASDVRGWGKKTWVYDTKGGTELEAGPTTKDKRSNDIRVNAFDREGF
ncbi:hypothetical protein I2I11_03585 [Pontibacter sp. 172403-2]|uniref:hypothetical protein n=1 Tax=Pontibacter rufus TaxID=2791028 RepID=UPI0018AFBE85|nr:hypothetical protein [Pontibacter sp. 172403-2]MBF9252366.1 hypothetical protein [Pontibacter sp. 172403-2]